MMMMTFPFKILTVDPGHNTGLAIFNTERMLLATVIWHKNFTTALLSCLHANFQFERVIAEGIPRAGADKITQEVYYLVKYWTEQVELPLFTVSPGLWKPVVRGVKVQLGDHAQDAVKLAFYHFNTQ